MTNTDLVRQRKRADVTQEQLAARLGISPRSLRYFETEGRSLPRARTRRDYIEGIAAIKRERTGSGAEGSISTSVPLSAPTV